MRIGFIGAGKLGNTFGKYFSVNGIEVSGYFSKSEVSAKEASEFTGSKFFASLEELVSSSDAIFLTVPDGAIKDVWNEIKDFSLKGKCICHTSGATNSLVFEGIDERGAFGYSIHPLFAVSSKHESFKTISKAYISVEGSEKYLSYWKELFEGLGNTVCIISPENKTLYHAACVFSSNLMIGLYQMGADLLKTCGFDDENALKALAPLMQLNAENAAAKGPINALTGPVERGDSETVLHHLQVLPENAKEVYTLLSKELLKIAKEKNPGRDFEKLEDALQ